MYDPLKYGDLHLGGLRLKSLLLPANKKPRDHYQDSSGRLRHPHVKLLDKDVSYEHFQPAEFYQDSTGGIHHPGIKIIDRQPPPPLFPHYTDLQRPFRKLSFKIMPHRVPDIQGHTWGPVDHHQHHQHHHIQRHTMPYRAPTGEPPESFQGRQARISQALDMARESPDGASNPTIANLLDAEYTRIWHLINTQPNYVMTKQEFSLFNYFQHRHRSHKKAISATSRFWRVFHG